MPDYATVTADYAVGDKHFWRRSAWCGKIRFRHSPSQRQDLDDRSDVADVAEEREPRRTIRSGCPAGWAAGVRRRYPRVGQVTSRRTFSHRD